MSLAQATSEGAEPEPEAPRYLGGAAQLAAWGFVFLILRIFAVSGYDWDTAFLVSTTLGLDDGLALLFGTLMAGHVLTSILLIIVVPLLIAGYLWGPREHRPLETVLTTMGLVILLALTVSFHSWWLPLAAVAVFAGIALMRRLLRRGLVQRASILALARASGVAGLAALIVAAFVTTPWVPLETIDTTDGSVTGYVLSVDPGYLNVLTEEQEFVIILSTDVRARR